VAGLVVGDHALLVLVDDPVLLLQAPHDAIHRLLQVGHGHFFAVGPGRQQRALVEDVLQVRAG
jgi:hypothetical protein